MAEETSHLAPHGVPSNPIPRALSSTRLHDLANQDQGSYGATYQTNDGNLGIPGQAGKGFKLSHRPRVNCKPCKITLKLSLFSCL